MVFEIASLLPASSKVSLSFCIPILLGIIKGCRFCSDLGEAASALALSFKCVFLVILLLGGCGRSSSGGGGARPLELDDPPC